MDFKSLLFPLLASVALSSCAMPSAARTGSVLPPDSFRFGGTIGGTYGSSGLPDATPMESLGSYALAGQLGLVPRLEVQADLGILRQGGAFRFDVTNARRGEKVSTALMVGGAFLPFRGGEVSGGIDLSVPLGQILEPLLNVGVSYGEQWYNIPHPNPETLNIEQTKYQLKSRTELRVQAVLGCAINMEDTTTMYSATLGVGPYWILDATGSNNVENGTPDGILFTVGLGVGDL